MPVTDERGAVAVLVALTMTVILGVGALVLDVGALYVERRELQNGADAAALAIANECVLGTDACDDVVSTATEYADANADDGLANVDDVQLDMKQQEVTVKTSTKTEDGDEVEFGFARIFGVDGETVAASATASWGTPQRLADPIPITISLDEYTRGAEVLLCFKQNSDPDCADGFGGAMDGPGAFGYVEAAGCRALNSKGKPLEVSDKSVDVDPGNDGPKNLGCTSASFRPDPKTPTKPRIVFLPVHDKLAGGSYSIVGFAAVAVDAFKFTGNKDEWCWSLGAPIECGGNQRFLHGRFVDYVVQGVPMAKPTKSKFTGVAVIELTK
jgi:hypothetical protein